MSYVTMEDYTEKYMGEPVAEADFPSLEKRAAEIIEEMSLYRIQEDRMDSFREDVQERIRMAVCAEMEYLDANVGSDLDNGAGLQSGSLGKYSFSQGNGAEGYAAQSVYSPRAVRLLMPTGLLYRGGGGP